MSEEVFSKEKEYYALFDVINKYDDRFLIIKSWGVTLSMAALGLGFQYPHYGFFLIACISSLTFGVIEGTMKRHQMRYYIRMRDIESESLASGYRPQIDWSWKNAPKYYKGYLRPDEALPNTERYGIRWGYRLPFLHSVVFPYIVSFIAGAVLFYMGYAGRLKLPDGNLMPL